jgi:hypothetical protein
MSLYRDDNNIFEIDGVEYIQADVYNEVINDIERRVKEACDYMKKNPPRWISDALDTLEELEKDLY